jgi:hypothetical protein
MMPDSFSPVANHLWQSSLFVAVASAHADAAPQLGTRAPLDLGHSVREVPRAVSRC